MGQLSDAKIYFEKCGNEFRPAIIKLASLHRDLEDVDKVITLLKRAIALDPANPDAYAYLGDTLNNAKKFAEAIQMYEKCLLKANGKAPIPMVIQTLNSIGDAYCNLKRSDVGIGYYDRAISLAATQRVPPSMTAHVSTGRFFAAMEIGLWRHFERRELDVINIAIGSVKDRSINNGVAVVSPYRLLFLQYPSISNSVATSWSRALIDLERKTSVSAEPDHMSEITAHSRPSSCSASPLSLGYLSRRFYEYPGTQLMLHLFGAHNRSMACISSIAYGPDDGVSSYRSIVANTSDAFRDITFNTTAAAASLVKSMAIDVLIDYDGLHDFNSIKLLAHRVAKLQISWLGFAGTSGQSPFTPHSAVDYLMADRFVLPAELSPRHIISENMILLPHYQPQSIEDELFSIALTIGDRHVLRVQLMAKYLNDTDGTNRADRAAVADGKWILSFNRMSKMGPVLFHQLANLARMTPNAYLLLLAESPAATEQMRLTALFYGIPASRLLIFNRLPKDSYRLLLKLGDLFIDTRNYNSHTVASDAMMQGTPIISLPGVTFASRVASSLCDAAAVDTVLVEVSEKGWENTARRLLNNADGSGNRESRGGALHMLRRHLHRVARGRCLGNNHLFTSHIEHAAHAAKELDERFKGHIFFESAMGQCNV